MSIKTATSNDFHTRSLPNKLLVSKIENTSSIFQKYSLLNRSKNCRSDVIHFCSSDQSRSEKRRNACANMHWKTPKFYQFTFFIHLHRDEWKLRYLPRRRNLKLETRIGRRFRTPWMTGCKSGTESKQQLLWWGMLKGEKERRATDAEVEVGDVQLVGVEPFEWNSENVLGETEVVQMQEHQSWTSLNT